MTRRAIKSKNAFGAVLVLTLAACSSAGTPTLTSGLPEGTNNAAPSAASAQPAAAAESAEPALPSLSVLTKGSKLPVGSPTEVYTRIARGAQTCWFGAQGPLKGPYIYYADAEPPSKGGKAEIVVRTRDTTAKDPRSLKAYKIGIEAGGEGTKLDVENVKIPEPLATRLASDANRWAAGEEGCGEEPVTAGWGAQAPAPAATKPKPDKKTAAKAATPVKN